MKTYKSEVVANVEAVLKEKEREKSSLHYYRMMIQFDKEKYEAPNRYTLEELAQQIICQSYTQFKTILLEH